MFYEAAGGRHYTGLWNAYQSFVDLSSLLNADRAILVAQVPVNAQETAQAPRCCATAAPLRTPQGNISPCIGLSFP